MSGPPNDSHCGSPESLDDESITSKPPKDSVNYARYHVTEDLHPAFAETGIDYNARNDNFVAEIDDVYDEAALFDSQKAFADALERFQEGVAPEYKSKVNLQECHSWEEVMQYATEARKKYTGVDKKGIAKKINNKLKTFQTAAPAVQSWLKLLPSTSMYGSVVCGGLTIILEVCYETLIVAPNEAYRKVGSSPSQAAPERDSACTEPDATVNRKGGVFHTDVRLPPGK